MHIPDGYLSPSTCAALYAASAPFWYVAFRRVKRALHTSVVPLISVFSAFSFIVMMFNLPLPGGTTGHAVGMGIATIVLGPWAATLAISMALTIQALLFGDGGITAIGANCFNMAILGSLAAYGVYRAAAWRSGLRSVRRVVAGAAAGYVGINVAALCAAVEFGIQPMLFHAADGSPLYCPYPLNISIPAMMIGHLTLAGLAELVVTAGVVAYLQRADPGLLKSTASDAPASDTSGAPSMKKLWIGLAVLLAATPLGILATGSAWGEWSPAELAGQLAASAPSGMRKLSNFWIAPVARYAPSFVPSESVGYLISAAMGIGVILLVSWVLSKVFRDGSKKRTTGFVEATIRELIVNANAAIFAEELAAAKGLLQSLDPRVKVVGMVALIVASVSVRKLWAVGLMLLLAVTIGLLSRVPVRVLFWRVWIPALSFTGAIAIPAIFLVPGDVVARVIFPVTAQGLKSAAMLILRAETAATYAILLVLCTEWTRVLKALRFFRVPLVAVMILGMTYRYLFLLLKGAQEMFESRQSRLVGPLPGSERRRVASGTAGVLLSRSFQLSSEVHMAMRARGFQGEIHLLEDPRIGARDWAQLGAFLALAGAAMAVGG
jgi:cobalt/nickel transport system permease protein